MRYTNGRFSSKIGSKNLFAPDGYLQRGYSQRRNHLIARYIVRYVTTDYFSPKMYPALRNIDKKSYDGTEWSSKEIEGVGYSALMQEIWRAWIIIAPCCNRCCPPPKAELEEIYLTRFLEKFFANICHEIGFLPPPNAASGCRAWKKSVCNLALISAKALERRQPEEQFICGWHWPPEDLFSNPAVKLGQSFIPYLPFTCSKNIHWTYK